MLTDATGDAEDGVWDGGEFGHSGLLIPTLLIVAAHALSCHSLCFLYAF